MTKLWFRNKRYGYGWYPCSLEGWLVLAAYIMILTCIVSRVNVMMTAREVVLQITLPVLALTGILVAIAAKTGEKPEWRWGGKPLRKK